MNNNNEVNDLVIGVGGYLTGKVADGLIGNDLSNWAETLKIAAAERLANINNILHLRAKKAESQRREISSVIPARIAERILNEGSYCSQYIMQEYYAGVLLSSQDEKINDDGILHLSMIHRLTSLHLKAHYVFYQMMKEALNGKIASDKIDIILAPLSLARGRFMSVNAESLLTTLFGEDFSEEPTLSVREELSRYEKKIHAIVGTLRREELISSFRATYDTDKITKDFYNDKTSIEQSDRKHFYYTYRPSSFGIMLYMWGQGYGAKDYEHYLDEKIICPRFINIELENFYYHTLDSDSNPFLSHLEKTPEGGDFSLINKL